MKKYKQEIFLAIILIGFSVAMYDLHFNMFHDMHHILLYFVGDIAFLGVQAMIAYFALDRLLNYRDRAATQKKLNMLAGIFFCDLGITVFSTLTTMLSKGTNILDHLTVKESWTHKDILRNKKQLAKCSFSVSYDHKTVKQLAKDLAKGKDLIIRLMEHPSLHEHEAFSDMLLALFHLTEELLRRSSLDKNPAEDKAHLANDMKRVYMYMSRLWLEYMLHLKDNYPYLYLYNIKNRKFD